MTSDGPAEPRPPHLSYVALFLQFLRFGALAFGGPVAQIAMIRRKLIDEDQWMSNARFNRLLAVLQALPGPEAHELCVHLGMRAKGRIGGMLAGLGFMLPGLVLMLGLAWLYFSIGVKPDWMTSALLGIQIAVLAVIIRAAHRIGRHILSDRGLWIIGAASCAAFLLGVTFWLILPMAGLAYALAQGGRRLEAAALFVMTLSIGAAARFWLDSHGASPAMAAHEASASAAIASLFFTGLKAGLLTFGGAYTAIPVMRSDAARGGWISDGQFLDGVALAQVIPAPLIIFGTFVGYAGGGFPGALAVTAGVFLPAFSFSLIFYDRLERILENRSLHALLDGVAAAVVGLILATVLQLGASLLETAPSWPIALAIFGVALTAAWRWRAPMAIPVILVLAGAAGVAAFWRL
ncbi:chromate efflux transporter [Brevundimonas sp.]|uniref:chromate efflux transporter n=1 Tax=Brevundimonas sp. TaxID=1871086 RepID=UPI002ED9118E